MATAMTGLVASGSAGRFLNAVWTTPMVLSLSSLPILSHSTRPPRSDCGLRNVSENVSLSASNLPYSFPTATARWRADSLSGGNDGGGA